MKNKKKKNTNASKDTLPNVLLSSWYDILRVSWISC